MPYVFLERVRRGLPSDITVTWLSLAEVASNFGRTKFIHNIIII